LVRKIGRALARGSGGRIGGIQIGLLAECEFGGRAGKQK